MAKARGNGLMLGGEFFEFVFSYDFFKVHNF
jgi:hypothetical protein